MSRAGAAQRRTIFPSRQRQTRRGRSRTPLCGLSITLVETKQRAKLGDKPKRLTVNISVRPSRKLAALKEAFQLFWDYRQTGRAADHLRRWMHSAMRSRLEPFKDFVRLLRGHLEGVLAWTRWRVSNGALEGMNNKIKLVSH